MSPKIPLALLAVALSAQAAAQVPAHFNCNRDECPASAREPAAYQRPQATNSYAPRDYQREARQQENEARERSEQAKHQSEQVAAADRLAELNARLPCRLKILNGPAMGFISDGWELDDENDPIGTEDLVEFNPLRCQNGLCSGYTYLLRELVQVDRVQANGVALVSANIDLDNGRSIKTALYTKTRYLSCRYGPGTGE